MKKLLILGGGIFVILAIIITILAGSVISTSNREVELRTLVEAKQKDNKNQFDNRMKTINQTAQVTKEQEKFIKDVIVGNSAARATKGGSLATLVHEAIPNIDTSVFNNLMNIITAARNEWSRNQTELLDLSREHTTLLRRFPSGFILGLLGRHEISITIVTSDKTEKAFESGQDNDTKVFE